MSIRNVKKHLSNRLSQRYGINLSPGKAADTIRSYIYSQGCTTINKETQGNRRVYLITINSKQIPVVYDHDIKCPVTVLTFRQSMVN